MREPMEVLDELSDESVDEDLTPEEWLDYLISLRDDLDMRISAVHFDVDSKKHDLRGL